MEENRRIKIERPLKNLPFFRGRSASLRANNLQLVSKQYQTTINVSKFIVTAMIINGFKLFKLNRCRRFCGVVEHDAVDVLDLVHDAVGGGGDGLRRQDRDLGGHEIRRGDGAQSNGES